MQKPYLPVRAVKVPRLKGGSIGPRTESCVNWDRPIAMVPCLNQGNIYTKRKLWVWRDQKCIPLVGAKPYLAVRAVKIPRLEGGSIRPRMESYVNLDGPITMVPYLHQGNIYTKRKLRVWRDQKCIPLVGAKTILTCAGRKNTPSRGRQYRAQNGKCINWDGPIAMGPFSHKGNIYTKRKLRVWRDHKCIPLVGTKTILTCAGRQNTPSRGRQYRAQNGKLRQLEQTYRHGTVFAPRQ